jgi:hypothetical protein
VETRPANGGNGPFDGSNGTPSRFELVLGGLPAGSYDWTSFHHDVERIWSDFQVEVSTDGGATFGPISAIMTMTDSSPGGNPASPQTYDGPVVPGSLDPADLPSTFTTTFTASGTAEVVFRFISLSEEPVHRAFFGVNGFQLTQAP